MIVDLRLSGRTIVVAGGGREAEKRIKQMINEKCDIIVISDSITEQIESWRDAGRLSHRSERIGTAGFIRDLDPYMVVAATDDHAVNRMILDAARKDGIISYGSDDPEGSDFSNLAVFDVDGMVRVAISTNGRSPAVSKRLREEAERVMRDMIRKEDIVHVGIQDEARRIARDAIPAQDQRRECLRRIMEDDRVNQLIRDGQADEARRRAIAMVRDWR